MFGCEITYLWSVLSDVRDDNKTRWHRCTTIDDGRSCKKRVAVHQQLCSDRRESKVPHITAVYEGNQELLDGE